MGDPQGGWVTPRGVTGGPTVGHTPPTSPHRLHGDRLSGLHPQVLLALQKVLADPVRPLCSHYGAVVGLHALGWKVRG